MSKDGFRYKIFFLSLLLALLLNSLPLPAQLQFLNPQWFLMVVLFWILSFPARCHLFFAFLAGLFFDLWQGMTLGVHAFSYLLSAFVLLKLQPRFKFYGLWRQSFTIFFILSLNQLSVLVCQFILQQTALHWIYFESLVSSLLIWPWLFVVLTYWNLPKLERGIS